MSASAKSFLNGQCVSRSSIPVLAPQAFREELVTGSQNGARICEMFALPDGPENKLIIALKAHDDLGRLTLISTRVRNNSEFPSSSEYLPSVQAMERALYEDHGLKPLGHPWLKALRGHPDLSHAPSIPHPFLQAEGVGIHEVAVGPVHAGVIEPGHFRFQCSGETVHTLEIHLGYQHRGAIAAILAANPKFRLAVVESLVGDGAVSHALAYTTIVEGLAGCSVPVRAKMLRTVALEIERISDHVGDFGALCHDVGYLPGGSWCPRLRGDIQNALGVLTGHRFGRGYVVPGGVAVKIDYAAVRELDLILGNFEKEFLQVASVALDVPSVLLRFEGTGTLSTADAKMLGILGPAARASGLDIDARRDLPPPGCSNANIDVAVFPYGDVLSRARIRVEEIKHSIAAARGLLQELPEGPQLAQCTGSTPNSVAVGIIEGPRGATTHIGVTGSDGELVDYRVVEPSLLNWPGLAFAMRGQQISDFPLCNKSFDLSYAGHDL